MDLSNQAIKFVCILNIVEEAFNLPLFYQQLEFLEDTFQLPDSSHLRPNLQPSRVGTHCSSSFLLISSSMLPPDTGLQSEAERVLILGTKDSIARLFAFVCWSICKLHRQCMWEEGHTSQFSMIKQRPPATDLSGGKASADTLTPCRNNLAAEDAVDFHRSNLLSSVVLNWLWLELRAS